MKPHSRTADWFCIEFVSKTSSKRAGHLSRRSYLSQWRNTQSKQLSLRELVETDTMWRRVHWRTELSEWLGIEFIGGTNRAASFLYISLRELVES